MTVHFFPQYTMLVHRVVIFPFSMGQSQSDSARVSGYVHCDLSEIMQPNQPKHDHYSHSYYLAGGLEHFYFSI